MIADKVYEFLSQGKREVNAALLEKHTALIGAAIKRQLMEEREHTFALRPSNCGQCPRKLSFLAHGAPRKPLSPRTQITFLYGDLTEQIALVLAKLAGVEIWSEQNEVMTLAGIGHIDCSLHHEGKYVPVDIKSMSDPEFKRFEDSDGPFDDDTWGYVTQLGLYAQGMDAPFGLMLGVRKSTGHMHERVIERCDARIVEIASAAMSAVSHDPKEVSRPAWATVEIRPRLKCVDITDVRCGYCDVNESCWPGVVVDATSGKPQLRIPLDAARKLGVL